MTPDKKTFTLQQIHVASKKIKSGADFPQFIQDLQYIGVTHYDNYVADGQTTYYGLNNFALTAEPKYPVIQVNASSSSEKLKQAISIHQQGKTDYPTFCSQAAEAGVEKWTTDIIQMIVTYLDQQGNPLTVERIPQP